MWREIIENKIKRAARAGKILRKQKVLSPHDLWPRVIKV